MYAKMIQIQLRRNAVPCLLLIAIVLSSCSGVQVVAPATNTPLPPEPSIATDTPAIQEIVVTATLLPEPRWTIFTDGNAVRDLAFDTDGTLWAATAGGVVAWNVTDQTYTKYTTLEGLPTNQISQAAAAPDGSLWFATDSGVLHYDGASWQTYTISHGLLSNNVTMIAVAPDRSIWAGTVYDGNWTSAGLSHFDGQTWKSTTHDNGLDDGLTAIAFANDGTLWLASGVGLLHVDTGGMPIQLYSVADGLPSTSIFDLLFTPDGSLWIATDAGVVRYDGQNWQLYDTSTGLVHNQVFDIALAPDGRMWFATSGGITVYDGEEWQSYATGEFPEENIVFALAFSSDGSLYAGTERGVVRMDEVNRLNLRTTDPPVSDALSVAVAPDGIVWVGTGNHGILRFDSDRWQRFTTLDGLPDESIHAIAFAPDGSPWVASWRGASRFDGNTWQAFPIENDQIGNSFHPIAVMPDGTVWMGTGRGLLKLDQGAWQLASAPDLIVLSLLAMPDNSLWVGADPGLLYWKDGKLAAVDTGGKLENKRLWALQMTPDGILWAGTSEGLYSFDGQAWTQIAIFKKSVVSGLALGADGALWAGSWQEGVAVYDGGSWQTLPTHYDLVSNVINAISVAQDGSVWFAGQGGLSHFQP